MVDKYRYGPLGNQDQFGFTEEQRKKQKSEYADIQSEVQEEHLQQQRFLSWLDSSDGRGFLKDEASKVEQYTSKGHIPGGWLDSPLGQLWLKKPSGKIWLKTQDGKNFSELRKTLELSKQKSTALQTSKGRGIISKPFTSTSMWGKLIQQPTSSGKKLGRPLGKAAKERALLEEGENIKIIQNLLRQAMFNLIGNVRKGNKIYRGPHYAPPTLMTDIERPFAPPRKFSASYVEMREYLKDILGWTPEQLEDVRDYSNNIIGGGDTQTYWLYQQGYLDIASSRWEHVAGRWSKGKDMELQKIFPGGTPDGEVTVFESQLIDGLYDYREITGNISQKGPFLPITYKKVTTKEEVGKYKNGKPKFKKSTNFFRLRHTYKINEKQRPQIEERLKRIESGQPEDSIENTLKIYDKDSALESDPALKKEVEKLKGKEEKKEVPLPEQLRVPVNKPTQESKPTTVYTPKEIQERLQRKAEQRREAQANRPLKKEPVQQPQKAPPAPKVEAPKIPPLRSAQPAQPIIEGGQRSGQRPVPPVPGTAKPTGRVGGGAGGAGGTKRPKYQEGGFVTF